MPPPQRGDSTLPGSAPAATWVPEGTPRFLTRRKEPSWEAPTASCHICPPWGQGAEATPSPLAAGSQCLSPVLTPGLATVPPRPGEPASVAVPGRLVCLEDSAAAVLRSPLPCFQAGTAKPLSPQPAAGQRLDKGQGTRRSPQPSGGHSSCSTTRQDVWIFGVEISKAHTGVFKVPLLRGYPALEGYFWTTASHKD